MLTPLQTFTKILSIMPLRGDSEELALCATADIFEIKLETIKDILNPFPYNIKTGDKVMCDGDKYTICSYSPDIDSSKASCVRNKNGQLCWVFLNGMKKIKSK